MHLHYTSSFAKRENTFIHPQDPKLISHVRLHHNFWLFMPYCIISNSNQYMFFTKYVCLYCLKVTYLLSFYWNFFVSIEYKYRCYLNIRPIQKKLTICIIIVRIFIILCFFIILKITVFIRIFVITITNTFIATFIIRK